jgi:hypothetical protein
MGKNRPIKTYAGSDVGALAGKDCPERGDHARVTGDLASRQCAREAAQIRNMRTRPSPSDMVEFLVFARRCRATERTLPA